MAGCLPLFTLYAPYLESINVPAELITDPHFLGTIAPAMANVKTVVLVGEGVDDLIRGDQLAQSINLLPAVTAVIIWELRLECLKQLLPGLSRQSTLTRLETSICEQLDLRPADEDEAPQPDFDLAGLLNILEDAVSTVRHLSIKTWVLKMDDIEGSCVLDSREQWLPSLALRWGRFEERVKNLGVEFIVEKC